VPPVPEPQAETPPPPEPKPVSKEAPVKAPTAPPRQVARAPAPRPPPDREHEVSRAPRLAPPRALDLEAGEKARSGDPYLNAARDRIEQHRTYPAVARPLELKGTAVFQIVLDRAGNLRTLYLVQSSGTSVLDSAAEGMVRTAAPFPPLPSDYPGGSVAITVSIHMFPE
jgi:protein TonB